MTIEQKKTVDFTIWSKKTILYALINEAKKKSKNLDNTNFTNINKALNDNYIKECDGVKIGVNFKDWPVVEYSCCDETYGEGFFNTITDMSNKDEKISDFFSNHLHDELNEFIAQRKALKKKKTKKNHNQCDSVLLMASFGILSFSIMYGVLCFN